MVDNKIKKLRNDKHFSQEQLAEKAKVSVRTIQRLEAGEDASISTLNLVAGALGVEVGDLFPRADSAKQKAKIQSADELLQSQLQQRHEEYKNFKRIYNVCYIIVMMLWGCLFPLVHNTAISSVMGVLWIGGWMIFGPLKKWIEIKRITPRLDAKYPLTINRINKNEN
ncbi:helix-turn-helix domain-containing protein [Limosilactobacillus sp. STM2_1]|uniref:Helix-turn-helix domain-containing protein n=1 Tax=Limosilactobacillus rudii TaxID=2759755 RepID=A0A7W3ULH8_9LACO|nr:helix-turn-helix transcriptional regulator [Limosilactobacillus rudii]MBB1079763.1 helix-turn-helix domain-containing protein [Limosilactobacillus rudii]MBB1097777.1 helix-turn-helix domain-containing protein [Limosilactobacillus rudii]MCD7134858.1 helix-turn-helix domain-containing protein [Limosilactobacillus rudii]